LATDPQGTGWLSAREQVEYRAIDDPFRRRDWRASRLAAKRAAARALGIDDPSRIELASRHEAAPAVGFRQLFGSAVPTGLSLSITHRQGRAAAAASALGMRIGVDLERVGTVRPSHARYYLTVAEQRALGGRDLAEAWALKEACWKALSCTGALPFTSVELRFDAAGAVSAISTRGIAVPARATVSSPWPGFVLAVLWLPGDLQ
jgi:phosphopantetheinyl transferase (holo-ACP synthase)